VERARASLRGARADRLPQTSIAASTPYGRLPETQAPAGAKRGLRQRKDKREGKGEVAEFRDHRRCS
jgi:hypothetical protein